jgi:lysophospholipase L1-like esterase
MRLGSAVSRRTRALPSAAAVLVSAGLVAAVTFGPPRADAGAAAAPRAVVAFGDSVPFGSACGCTPFPGTYAGMVQRNIGGQVKVTNLARGGGRSSGVRDQIETSSAQAAIRGASTVVIMIGANDFGPAFTRVRNGAPAEPEFEPVATAVKANVTRTVQRIRAIHSGPVTVAIVGYWNVFRDGRVARQQYTPAERVATALATSKANSALYEAAVATQSRYVSTWGAFKGSDGSVDPTPLLAHDGDHPNTSGHARIAGELYAKLPNG